jgi:hypothetical protein
MGIVSVCFTFIPVIMLVWKFNTKKWQTFLIGALEVIVMTSIAFLFYEAIFIGGH